VASFVDGCAALVDGFVDVGISEFGGDRVVRMDGHVWHLLIM
jgi:hypothetical protein